MYAAVFQGPNRIGIESVPVREPGVDEVRVRLSGCGVCGSNLPVWEGRPWFDYPFAPGAPGHEGWGRVDAVGEQARDVRVGDRVALLSYNAFAEVDYAPSSMVVPLPESLPDTPFPGEALGCALNVLRRSDIRSGHRVAVVGVGFLGALLVALARDAGATVTAISRRRFSLDVARTMGAHHGLPIEPEEDVFGITGELTDNTGFDRVIEAAGLQQSLDLASKITREGGRLVIAGFHQDGPRTVDMQLWNWRGIDVINAHERDPAVAVRGLREAVAAVDSGRLDPSPLYTHAVTLDELPSAFEGMAARPAGYLKGWVRL